MIPLFGLLLLGVVDRLEGDFAVVVWQDATRSDVALELVPCAREGDRVRLRLRRHAQPDAAIRVTSPTRSHSCTSKTRSRRSTAP